MDDHLTAGAGRPAISDSDSRSGNDDRYQQFHKQGRWQGQPLRVEDTDAPPRFEPAVPPNDLPAGAPTVLTFGVANHGMMAGQPTNCYLLGYVAGGAPMSLTIVDPGAADSLPLLLEALAGSDVAPERIARIVLTHAHPDHVGGAAALQQLSGAQVLAHPLERGHIGRWGSTLTIDHWIEDGVPIACEGFELEPIFTPGHSPGHVCLAEARSELLLAGDMISGFGSVGIFPPEGSMAGYIDSLRTLLAVHDARPFRAICPGHGPVIANARDKIEEYIIHRLAREDEIVVALSDGHTTMDQLLTVIYPDVQPHLSFAARATLQAHLDKLRDDARVERVDESHFALTRLSS